MIPRDALPPRSCTYAQAGARAAAHYSQVGARDTPTRQLFCQRCGLMFGHAPQLCTGRARSGASYASPIEARSQIHGR